MASNYTTSQVIGTTPVANEQRNINYPSTDDNNQEVNLYFGPKNKERWLNWWGLEQPEGLRSQRFQLKPCLAQISMNKFSWV